MNNTVQAKIYGDVPMPTDDDFEMDLGFEEGGEFFNIETSSYETDAGPGSALVDARTVPPEWDEAEDRLLHAPLANELASRLGMDAEEIETIARQHQLDLENLPQPPNSEVLKFLLEVDPQVKSALENCQGALAEKKTQDREMVDRANARNSTALASHKDTDDMNLAPFEYLSLAQRYEDAGSRQVQETTEGLQESLATALANLYPDSRLTFSVEVLQDSLDLSLPPPPELVPLAVDGRGRGRYERFNLPPWVRDYPTYSYQGRYRA